MYRQAGSRETHLRNFCKKSIVRTGSRKTPLRHFAKNVFGRLSAGIGYGFNGLTKNLYDGTMSLRLLIWTAEGAGRLLLM